LCVLKKYLWRYQESPLGSQSAFNSISGHGISEIISPGPNKVLVYCDDINTITAKKKPRYATQTAAKKKARVCRK
jgi:hypothetical protein